VKQQSFFRRHGGLLSLIVMVAVVLGLYFLTGLRPCAVVSGSMEPTIPTWSLCLVNTKTPYEDVEEDDIVVYIRGSDGKRIIHRAIELTDDGFVMQGDNNAVEDPELVTEDNYYGRYLFHVPYLGKLPMLIRTPVGIAVCAGVFIVLLILTLVDDRRGRRE